MYIFNKTRMKNIRMAENNRVSELTIKNVIEEIIIRPFSYQVSQCICLLPHEGSTIFWLYPHEGRLYDLSTLIINLARWDKAKQVRAPSRIRRCTSDCAITFRVTLPFLRRAIENCSRRKYRDRWFVAVEAGVGSVALNTKDEIFPVIQVENTKSLHRRRPNLHPELNRAGKEIVNITFE